MGIQVQRTAEKQMEILMGIVLDLQKQVQQSSRKMIEEIEKRVSQQIESKTQIIHGRLALREAVMLKQLLIEKGIITEDEFIAKLKE